MKRNTIHAQKKGTHGLNFAATLMLALLVVIALNGAAWGATAFWHGQGSTANWSDTANWDDDSTVDGDTYTPINGDSLRWFPSTAGNQNSTNDLVGLSVSSISFQGGATSGIELNGNTLMLTGNINQGGVGPTINLPLELNNNVRIEGGTGGKVLTVNGLITETGGSRKLEITSGGVALYGENSFSGDGCIIGISSATLYINTLSDAGTPQSLGTGNWFQLGHNANTATIIYTGGATSTDKQVQPGRAGSYTGSGIFLNNGTGAVVWTGDFSGTSSGTTSRQWTLGGTNADTNTWEGLIRNFGNNDIMGLTKIDAGKWIVSGDNTYTGTTDVDDGILWVNGTHTGASNYTVNAGAGLGGSGTITLASDSAVTVADGAFLDPGAGVGTLTVNGDLDFEESANVTWEYENAIGDLVAVNGTLTLPTAATVTVTQVAGDLPVPATLFSATDLTGATDLSGWTVLGALDYPVLIEGNDVVLASPPRGSLFIFR